MNNKGIIAVTLWAILVAIVLVIAVFFPHLMGDEIHVESFIRGILFAVVSMVCALMAVYKRDWKGASND